MTLKGYIGDLEPEQRPVAREWGEMESGEFQARMGPEISRIVTIIEVRPRWYNLRVSEIARIAAVAVAAVIGKGSM